MGGKFLEKNSFGEAVCEVVSSIPYGKTATYGQVASLAGYPGYARQVSRALRMDGAALPWHRVVSSNTPKWLQIALKGHEHSFLQKERLQAEGVCVRDDMTLCRASYSWLPMDFVK